MTASPFRRVSPPDAMPGARRAVALVAVLVVLALGLTAAQFAAALPPPAWGHAALHPDPADAAQLVFHLGVLPRAVVAALCGAGLAAAGGLTQAVLRNPLAVPGTLGVTAGAQLAALLAGLLLPASLGIPREAAALVGGMASLGLVFAAAAPGRFSSLALVLAGLSVGLFCAALGGVLKLFNHEYLGAVVLWGAGSLVQEGWSSAATLALVLPPLALAAALLLHPIAVIGLSDDGARGLGLSLALFRLLALGVAVALSATVTAAVGIVGFVDFAAPLLVRLAGVRRLGPRLALSAVAGAAMLLIVDACVLALNDRTGAFLPTGAVTAVLAAPLVLVLLPRLRTDSVAGAEAGDLRRAGRPVGVLVLLALGGAFAVLLALGVGRTASGWSLPDPATWPLVAPWRAPRTAVAFAAGAALAAAGTLLQRATGNPLASPESLGLGAAATVGFTATLLVDPSPSTATLAAAGGASALALLAVLTGAGLRSRFAPDHLLLTGVALTAALNALVVAFLSLNDARAAVLTSWMAGSTAAVDGPTAAAALLWSAVLIPLALVFARPLDLIPLGEGVARAAGVPLGPARFGIMLLAALLTAGAVLAVGPLTFVGLLGPQIATRLGLVRSATQLPGAALAGALVMVLADWAGRVAAAPFEVPAGLAASLIGIPILVVLLGRRARVA